MVESDTLCFYLIFFVLFIFLCRVLLYNILLYYLTLLSSILWYLVSASYVPRAWCKWMIRFDMCGHFNAVTFKTVPSRFSFSVFSVFYSSLFRHNYFFSYLEMTFSLRCLLLLASLTFEQLYWTIHRRSAFTHFQNVYFCFSFFVTLFSCCHYAFTKLFFSGFLSHVKYFLFSLQIWDFLTYCWPT